MNETQYNSPDTAPSTTGLLPPTIRVFRYPVESVVINSVRKRGEMATTSMMPGTRVGPSLNNAPMKRNGDNAVRRPNTAELVRLSKYTLSL